MQQKLLIDETGIVEMIYSDDLRGLLSEGCATIQRASHVEPTADGRWTADMGPINGPLLGPFLTRGEALHAETQWIEARL